MHLSKTISALALCLTMAVSASAQEQDTDSTGLPGDNFSLQGALDLFKKAGSPEEFEKLLNSQDNKVNNLDLNADGKIDYVRVVNKKENDVQIFVLSAIVSAEETQDVAVISLQKNADESAMIQIEGDADIYGESTIAEPTAETETENAFMNNDFSGSAYASNVHGPAVSSLNGIFVNVWFWPCVRFVYAPAYVVYASPVTWIAPPVWWRPWTPMPYYEYYPYCAHYRTHYVYVPTRRIAPARVMYRPVRMSSVTVINRNRVVVNNYRNTRVQSRSGYYGNSGGGRYSNPGGRTSNYNNGGGRSGYNNGGSRNTFGGNPNGGRTYNPGNNGGGRSSYGGSSTPGGTRQSAPASNGGGRSYSPGNNSGGSRSSVSPSSGGSRSSGGNSGGRSSSGGNSGGRSSSRGRN